MKPAKNVIAYIGLGSNLADRTAMIERALRALDRPPAVHLTNVSAMLENPAVGGPTDSPPFLNAVAEIETTLEPQALLGRLLEIERSLGRERRERWAPRTIDLDLLLYGERIIDEPNLRIPHPRMHERRFVLEPLVQIAPDVVHPLMNRSVRNLLDDLLATNAAGG